MTPTRDWRWHHLLTGLLLTGALLGIVAVVVLEVLALIVTMAAASLG